MPIDAMDGMSRSQIMKLCDTVGAALKKAALDPANTDPDNGVHVMDLVCQLMLDINRLATAVEKIEGQMPLGE